MVDTVILVIRADRSVRVARKPRLGPDEVGVRVNLAFPSNWGKVIGAIDVVVPDFAPEVRYEQVDE
jgi:hypothetical protein